MSLNQVPALAGVRSTAAGWQVTLCDPIWHVISRSGVVKFHGLLYSCFTLLYFYDNFVNCQPI